MAGGRNHRNRSLLQRGLGRGGVCVGKVSEANFDQNANSVQQSGATESRASAVKVKVKVTQIFGAPLKLGHLQPNHILESKVPKWEQNLTSPIQNWFAKM